jgi:hypothetical protein
MTTMTLNESVDVSGMYDALQDLVRQGHSERVAVSKLEYARSYRDHSLWYAWGRMDGGESVTVVYGRRVDAAWEFGYMMGIMALMYVTERRYSMPSIQSAWQAFKASIDIDQYVI